MSNALLLALVAPANDASEAEFNRWYDEVHIPQVVERVPGVVAGRRYQLVPDLDDAIVPSTHGYLTLYELDTDDLVATAKRLGEAATDGTLDMSTALNTADRAPVLRFFRTL